VTQIPYLIGLALAQEMKAAQDSARQIEPFTSRVLGFRSAPRPGAQLAEIVEAIGWIAHGFEIVHPATAGTSKRAGDRMSSAVRFPPWPTCCRYWPANPVARRCVRVTS
jgi:hypothetical protein